MFFAFLNFKLTVRRWTGLRSLATDISQRVVQYYRDNKTSRFEDGTGNLDWRRRFFCSLYQELSWERLQFFLKPASEIEKKKEAERGKNFSDRFMTHFHNFKNFKDKNLIYKTYDTFHISLVCLVSYTCSYIK